MREFFVEIVKLLKNIIVVLFKNVYERLQNITNH